MQAVTGSPQADAIPVGARRAPWGLWTSILWVVAAEGLRNLVDIALDTAPVQALNQSGYLGHVVVITVSWATPLAVIAVAARWAGWSVGEYLAFHLPRGRDVALAIAAGLALEASGHAVAYALAGTTSFPVDDYHSRIVAGTWPWLYVLLYWPASVYAPFVEETTYRGFLWRGAAASRLGNGGALLVTSFFFAAIHYHYYFQNGMIIPAAFLSPFLSGLLLGWIRWRTGSTIAAMIAHSTMNTALAIGTVLAVKLAWP